MLQIELRTALRNSRGDVLFYKLSYTKGWSLAMPAWFLTASRPVANAGSGPRQSSPPNQIVSDGDITYKRIYTVPVTVLTSQAPTLTLILP